MKTILLNFSGGHEFKVFSKEQCTFDKASKKWILNAGEQPLMVMPAPSKMLRANLKTEIVGTINLGENVGIPDTAAKIEGCDALPQLAENEIGVVSIIYAQAAKAQGWDMSKFRTTVPCYPDISQHPCGIIELVQI